jgi:hypothetical protein
MKKTMDKMRINRDIGFLTKVITALFLFYNILVKKNRFAIKTKKQKALVFPKLVLLLVRSYTMWSKCFSITLL